MKFLSVLATAVTILVSTSTVAAQNCGPQFGNIVCATGRCCSQYGWCDNTPAHCDPSTCNRQFSGPGSSCRALSSTTKRPTPTSTKETFMTTIPHIDVCGAGSGGITCPGAGSGGYFYRCCSGRGHCGPKNSEQDPRDYCGAGCQPGFGKCDPERPRPPAPTARPTISDDDTCGPIVNKRCPAGQCCSGSNFCGTGPDFCGAANWCQVGFGECQR